MNNISVFCHEFGHMLGLPDLDARPENPGSEGLGGWCAMSNEGRGGRPQHFSAWCKDKLGWIKPTIIDPTVKQKLVLAPIETSSKDCLKVLVRPDGSEYFLLENRGNKGFDATLPGTACSCWRVVGNRPILEESHGVLGPRGPYVFGEYVPFPSESNRSFTPFTQPSSRSQLGGGLPVWITNIEKLSDGRVGFQIGYEYAAISGSSFDAHHFRAHGDLVCRRERLCLPEGRRSQAPPIDLTGYVTVDTAIKATVASLGGGSGPAYLGVSVVADAKGRPVADDVATKSPAAKAGIKKGDLLPSSAASPSARRPPFASGSRLRNPVRRSKCRSNAMARFKNFRSRSTRSAGRMRWEAPISASTWVSARTTRAFASTAWPRALPLSGPASRPTIGSSSSMVPNSAAPASSTTPCPTAARRRDHADGSPGR